MIGKRIRVSDYKFTYGQETVYVNVFGAFKTTNGEKYVVYSYDNKKLFCGSFYVRDKVGTVMISNNMNNEIIKQFVDDILCKTKNNDFEVIKLNSIESIQIIDEKECDFLVDINTLDELTIPKVIKQENLNENSKGGFSFATLGIILLFIVVGLFFFFHSEVITGKNRVYGCDSSYRHDSLPVNVKEMRKITFTSKGKLISMDVNFDYVFDDSSYYSKFKEKGYFYQYIEEGDTYKFVDDNYTYRIFRSIDTENDFLLPSEEEELILYYRNAKYDCNLEEE